MSLALPHSKLGAIDTYWSRELGCATDDLSRTGTTVHCDERLKPNIVRVFQCGDSTIVRVHSRRYEQVARAIGPGGAFVALGTAEIAERLAVAEDDAIVPLQDVAYLDAWDFRPAAAGGVVPLSADHVEALRALHRSCTRLETHLANVQIDHPIAFGYFVGRQLASAASFIYDGDEIADVGVLTDPDFRNRGYGRAVVSALCRWGLDRGRIVQYCALCTNLPSLQVARALGFHRYGREASILLPVKS